MLRRPVALTFKARAVSFVEVLRCPESSLRATIPCARRPHGVLEKPAHWLCRHLTSWFLAKWALRKSTYGCTGLSENCSGREILASLPAGERSDCSQKRLDMSRVRGKNSSL